MVLEQVFKEKWIEKKPRHAFILGVIYSIVGIFSARLIFGSNPGLMTVAFTSILLIPSLNQLLQHEENVEIREKKFHIKQLFNDHKDIFEIYIFMFLGVFLTFGVVSLILPMNSLMHMFAPQLNLIGIAGQATGGATFMSILINNIIVLFVCLVLSLVYGAGSILFITWNATVWGVIFAYYAKMSAVAGAKNPLLAFAVGLLPFLPHMITEAFSYFTAAITGGVMSKALLREDLFSKKFHHVMTDAWIILGIGFVVIVIAAGIEVFGYPQLVALFGL